MPAHRVATARQAAGNLRHIASDVLAKAPSPLPPDISWMTPFRLASAAELNDCIVKQDVAWTVEQRIEAIRELGERGFAIPQTYQVLVKVIGWDLSKLVPESVPRAQQMRRYSLWALGLLNRNQHWPVDTEQLPGLTTIERLLKNSAEHPVLKLAAVESLWVLDRATDKRLRSVLKIASKDNIPMVAEAAKKGLAGRIMPFPFPSSSLALQ